MSWFSKKEDEEAPRLPELPSLPELPREEERILPQLPSLPSNSIGEKFSQDTIKDAVQSKKIYDDEDDEEEEQISVPREFKEAAKIVRKKEPVFVRIDKFEESIDNFDKAKHKVSEIEKLLSHIKEIKEEEEEELQKWSEEVQLIKDMFENIDKELFSELE